MSLTSACVTDVSETNSIHTDTTESQDRQMADWKEYRHNNTWHKTLWNWPQSLPRIHVSDFRWHFVFEYTHKKASWTGKDCGRFQRVFSEQNLCLHPTAWFFIIFTLDLCWDFWSILTCREVRRGQHVVVKNGSVSPGQCGSRHKLARTSLSANGTMNARGLEWIVFSLCTCTVVGGVLFQ